jgi:hypothetical protein
MNGLTWFAASFLSLGEVNHSTESRVTFDRRLNMINKSLTMLNA